MAKGNGQGGRTNAPNIKETPRASQLKQALGGDNSGKTAPIKFTVKK